MNKLDVDKELESLPDGELRKRLAIDDWKDKAHHVKDEVLFGMFRRARSYSNQKRIGLLSEALSRRILARSRGFVIKSMIFPTFIDDLNTASHELAVVIWEQLLTSESDAARAEQAFGQLFNRRAIDFQRKFFAKKRINQSSLDTFDQAGDGEDTEAAERSISTLQDDQRPEDIVAKMQSFQQLRSAMLAVLTPEEFSTLEMRYDLKMPVKDVAKALNKTPRSINNYETRALAKLQKELSE
jgi:RNA polymerase sigma factor (sigma-70 family)